MENASIQFGENLKAFRLQAELSQEQLADRASLHRTYIGSVERGEPAEFPVTGVIRGWVEALQLMPVGSKWELVIPHNLAYGPQGNRGIPPFSTLVFEVELLEILAPESAE